MNPSLSFSLDERTFAALLQEDDSAFQKEWTCRGFTGQAARVSHHAGSLQHLLHLKEGAVQPQHPASVCFISPSTEHEVCIRLTGLTLLLSHFLESNLPIILLAERQTWTKQDR